MNNFKFNLISVIFIVLATVLGALCGSSDSVQLSTRIAFCILGIFGLSYLYASIIRFNYYDIFESHTKVESEPMSEDEIQKEMEEEKEVEEEIKKEQISEIVEAVKDNNKYPKKCPLIVNVESKKKKDDKQAKTTKNDSSKETTHKENKKYSKKSSLEVDVEKKKKTTYKSNKQAKTTKNDSSKGTTHKEK